MSSFPDDVEHTPEPPPSEVCMNLEDKFIDMQDASKGDRMQVYVRIRPMLDSEVEAGYKECIRLVNDQVIRAVAPSSSSKFKACSHLNQDIIEDFTFNAAYGPEAGQFVFFQECMMETMKNFIEGQNSLVFSYGTTGSGKTFTLQGNVDNPGIIPLSLHLFFASIENQLLDKIFLKPDRFSNVVALNDNEVKKDIEVRTQLLSTCNQEESSIQNSSKKSLGMLLCDTFSDHFEGEGCQTTLGPEDMAQAQSAALMKEISKKCAEMQSGYCSVWISFVEIYNENIYDLLQPNWNQRTKLSLGEDKNGDVYVKGLREVCIFNSHEALTLLNLGQKNLRIASTRLNYQSSRSHCIFTVKVIRILDPENMTSVKVNRLSFCDLAGSERAAKSHTTGLHLKEAGCINTSLLVLGRCLEQLRLKPSLRDKKLIPFRESKLTRLFSGFFTGRGKAVMITNASPCELTFDETLHVLRFSALAKELIINDSYITTASNTLQSIANMWTDAKNNYKNESQSFEKSISFEDSMVEVIEEKDKLIEKLLDLAESLRNNLEREKKEKAELEMKIRQDVCVEYSEYRDELLAMQKQAFEEEKETIREIYEKRIMTMEKRHEKIISDFQIQSEDHVSSDEEVFEDTLKSPCSIVMKQSEAGEVTFNSIEIDNAARDDVKETNKSKEEFKMSVDHSLALETELKELKKKYDDTQSMLENAIEENDVLQRELDACKIDKLNLDADLKAFRDDLVTVTGEKEALYQELTESKSKISFLNEEIQNLLENINELTLKKEESAIEYKKSLKEAEMKNKKLNDELLNILPKFNEEKEKRNNLEAVILSMEKKISELQSIEHDYNQSKQAIKTLSEDIDKLRNDNVVLQKKVEVAESSLLNSHSSESKMKDQMEKLQASHLEEIEKLNAVLKQRETDVKEAEDLLKSVNKILDGSLSVIDEQKGKLNLLEDECNSLKKELSQLQVIKEDMEDKLASSFKNLENEKSKNFELNKELEKVKEVASNFEKSNCILEVEVSATSNKLESEVVKLKEELESEHKKLLEALNAVKLQNSEMDKIMCEIKKYQDEIADLKKVKADFESKINSSTPPNDSEVIKLTQQLESEHKVIEEALNTISSQKREMDKIECENKKYEDELCDLKKINKDLESKLNSITSHNEAEMINLKQKLESEQEKLEQTLNSINAQKEEIEKLNSEKKKYEDELVDLRKIKKDLEDKLDPVISQNDVVQELLYILENCELKATDKIKILKSDVQELKEKFELNSINHEKECAVLYQLIEILEDCEISATKKAKKFHSSSIEHVEQIMDLETSAREKEKTIDVLNNDINNLQKKCKDIQTSSKKQLQAETQKFKSEIEEMDKRLADYKKRNESLKCDLAKLEAEKDKLEKEYNNLKNKDLAEKTNVEGEHNMKIKTPEKKSLRNRKGENTSDAKISENTDLKEAKNHEDKRRNKKILEESESITDNIEQKKETNEKHEAKKRNKKVAEKSENIFVAKKQKTKIYEEIGENDGNETKRQESKVGRRHLRSINNVAFEEGMIQKEDVNSLKMRPSKRKEDANKNESPEKKGLKKPRLHNINDIENASKPENLRVKLLKCSVNINDIPLPSPRMTRGRKRLVLAKENKASPRSVRS